MRSPGEKFYDFVSVNKTLQKKKIKRLIINEKKVLEKSDLRREELFIDVYEKSIEVELTCHQ